MSHGYYGDMPIRLATHCHVCSERFTTGHDHVIDHSGATMVHIDGQEVNGRGSIVMHPECATILAMRILHDVMDIRSGPEMRVVDALRNVRDAYQMK